MEVIRRTRRAILFGLVMLAVVVTGLGGPAEADPPRTSTWVSTWSASPQMSSTSTFTDRTMRMVLWPHFDGTSLRLRFSNRFGAEDVVLDDVFVGVSGQGAAVVPGTNRPVTFGGSNSVTLWEGAEAVSDPVSLPVEKFQRLSVSFHVPGPAKLDWHLAGLQTSYMTPDGAGSHGAATDGTAFTETTPTVFAIAAVDVSTTAPTAGTVVAFGDSITDGTGTTLDANNRWPNVLARRLAAHRPASRLSVANAGVAGNQVTAPDHRGFSPSAVARFEHDVLGRAGVSDVIVFAGGNDLILSRVPAERVIAGLQNIVDRAHARCLNVVGATITPRANFAGTPIEAERQAVNAWIRDSGAFDAVVDFDAVIRDPDNPVRPRAEYDFGDGVHLNDAGNAALAEAVDISQLVQSRPRRC